ncbi:Complement C1q tumor necrosis factor-related protein 8 [Manis javanica]|nr:Complement C1q tumor necrosis factor-related protein 8 [Manis javanica]
MPRLRRGGATCTLVCLTLGPDLWPVTSTYFRGRGQRSLWQEWEGGSPRLPGLLGPQGQKGQVGLPGATCQHIYWAFSVGWCEGLHSADTCQAVSFDTELVNLDGTFSLRQAAFSAPVLRRVPPEPQHVHLELQGDVPAYHVQPASAAPCRSRACWPPGTPSGCACSSGIMTVPSAVSTATSTSPSVATWSSQPQSSSSHGEAPCHTSTGWHSLPITPLSRGLCQQCLSTNCAQWLHL